MKTSKLISEYFNQAWQRFHLSLKIGSRSIMIESTFTNTVLYNLSRVKKYELEFHGGNCPGDNYPIGESFPGKLS